MAAAQQRRLPALIAWCCCWCWLRLPALAHARGSPGVVVICGVTHVPSALQTPPGQGVPPGTVVYVHAPSLPQLAGSAWQVPGVEQGTVPSSCLSQGPGQTVF